MDELRRAHGTAILLITHDMGVIARMAERVVVMYAGMVAEIGTLSEVLGAPAHPYTRLLLAAMPTARRRVAQLPVIPGIMPTPGAMPPGCRFHPRCPEAMAICRTREPTVTPLPHGRIARCWLAEEQAAAERQAVAEGQPVAEGERRRSAS
jgi:oligopeptide/dipeptide ABC transporter ATP-binding protein